MYTVSHKKGLKILKPYNKFTLNIKLKKYLTKNHQPYPLVCQKKGLCETLWFNLFTSDVKLPASTLEKSSCRLVRSLAVAELVLDRLFFV